MKRIIKFTILKVVEITGAGLVFLALAWYGHWVCMLLVSDYDPTCLVQRWIAAPILGCCITVIVLAGCFGIYKWIKWNWEKAGK